MNFNLPQNPEQNLQPENPEQKNESVDPFVDQAQQLRGRFEKSLDSAKNAIYSFAGDSENGQKFWREFESKSAEQFAKIDFADGVSESEKSFGTELLAKLAAINPDNLEKDIDRGWLDFDGDIDLDDPAERAEYLQQLFA